ncbi:MAG TPA: acyl carrier protein [Pirellulales bacterium]|nr:acyl carrier protein [Pirellulales bacterium]
MNREQIRVVLKTIFEEETNQSLASLDDDALLAEDFALDSVDLVSLLMRVESHFQVRLTNAELTDSRTVGALIDLVKTKVNDPAAQTNRLRAAA